MKSRTLEVASFEVDRRTMLQLGLLGGVGAALSGLGGCAGGGGGTALGPRFDEGLAKPSRSSIAISPLPPQQSPSPAPDPGTVVTGVIPRSAWTTSAVITSRCNPMNGVNRMTVHHAAIDSSDLRTADDVKRRLASIRNDHVNRRPEPFADIGYHYVIDPQGRVWEGRSTKWQGAHVADRNEHNLGIMLLGDFTRQRPSTSQLNSLDSFLSQQMKRYNIPVGRVYTHRELGKSACPGPNLQRYMDQTRSGGGRLRTA
ncbi:MAG: N-acetylmuramoyl-L-alanine amidase [Tepidisphaera sp.]|jgi:hypothetical protein